jgi:hypothetical protein
LRQFEAHKRIPMAAHWKRARSTDPDLNAVVDAWYRLPEAVRAGIVAMVKASAQPD